MGEKPDNAIRIKVHFSGRVQGVYFRATCSDLAKAYPVTGYVRNLADGRVELIAEGGRGRVEDFLFAIKKAKTPNIEHYEVRYLGASGEFSDFRIA